jgi:hypothetical protein
MKKLNENFSEIFDMEPIEVEKKTEKQQLAVVETGDAVINDTEFARKNIKQLIDTGNKSLEQLAAIADQSEHPRAFEVLAGLMKNLADMNKDLLELQKRKRDLAPKETSPANGVSIDKAVFVGSTAELVKMIKSNK